MKFVIDMKMEKVGGGGVVAEGSYKAKTKMEIGKQTLIDRNSPRGDASNLD